MIRITRSNLGLWLAMLLAIGSMGCATAKIYSLDDRFELEERGALGQRQLFVGVMPFSYSDDANDEAKMADGVDRFEGHFFAARLAATMEASGWFAGVYCIPDESPAVDALVYAHVNRSDGEVIDIDFELRDVNGQPLGETDAGIDLSSSSFEDEEEDDPGQRLWLTASNRIAEVLAEAGQLDAASRGRARMRAYTSGLPPVSTGAGVGSGLSSQLVAKAVEIERAKLLAPVTRVIEEQADAVRPAYVTWQARTTKLLEDKRRSRNTSIALGVLSMASMGMSTMAVAQGLPLANVQQANLASATGMAMAMSSAQESTAFANAAADLRGVFSQELQPLTVKLGGTVYNLVGSTEQQLDQIRQIVRDRLVAGQEV